MSPQSTPSPILEIRNLSKIYPNGTVALQSVSFQVYPGEFLAVIGSSGAGKSTLLRCLNRLHDASSGEIFYKGSDLTKIRSVAEIRLIRKQMAMIFQSFNLIPRQTVLQNVLMGRLAETGTFASLLGHFSSEDSNQALKHLSLVGIAEKASVRAEDLSGGQQQRVAIARALSQKPELLLADEPVASLDPAARQTVMSYLQKINREINLTVIANLHSVNLVRQYATRFIALKDGKLLLEGSPDQLTEALLEKIYGESHSEENQTPEVPL